MAATKQSAPDADLAQTLIDHREIARQQGDVLWELLLIPPIGKYLAAQGERAKAIELYRDAIERAKKLDNRSPQALHVQVELASFLMEDSQDVLEAYRLLSDVLSDIDILMRGVLLDERRSQIIDQWIAAYSKIIQLLIEKGEIVGLSKDMTTAELAFNHHEAAKSRTFIADLADATIIAQQTFRQS
jgi:hypothetical protein